MASYGMNNANAASASQKKQSKTPQWAGIKRKLDAEGDTEMPDAPLPAPKRRAGAPKAQARGDIEMTEAPPQESPQGIPVLLFGGRIGYLDPNSKPIYGPNDHHMILDKPLKGPRARPRQQNAAVVNGEDPKFFATQASWGPPTSGPYSHHSAPQMPRGPPPSAPHQMVIDQPLKGQGKRRGKRGGRGKGKGNSQENGQW